MRVQDYFDQDSERYSSTRYTSEYKDCHQFSYLARRSKVLDLLGSVSGHVLDVGCGPGIYTQDLLDRGCRTTACDISPKMIAQARARFCHEANAGAVNLHVGDIHELNAQPGSFDAAICIGVMAYIPDHTQFLRRLASLLRPGGIAVIQFSKKYSPKAFHEQCLYPILVSIKDTVMGRERSRDGDFQFRRYRPRQFNAVTASCGLQIEESAHFDYTIPLLSTLAVRTNLRLAESLEKRKHGLLSSILAGDYVARYRKSPIDDSGNTSISAPQPTVVDDAG